MPMRVPPKLIVLSLALAIAGCAPRGGGYAVTWVHLGQPIAAGGFAFESAAAAGGITPRHQVLADAVAAELGRIGFARQEQGAGYIVRIEPLANGGVDVKLRRAAGLDVVWEGKAVPADPARADPARMVRALFRGFPGESGATITVR